MTDYILDAVAWISGLPPSVIFIVLFLCATVEYIIPIVPGDTIVLLSGFLSGINNPLIWLAGGATIFGSLAGCLVAYFLGRFVSLQQHRIPRLKDWLLSGSLEKFSYWYRRYGWWLVLFNRFCPGIRSIFLISSGYVGLSLPKTIGLAMASALIYNSFLFFLGFYFGMNADTLITAFIKYSLWLFAALIFFALFATIKVIFNHKKNKIE